MYLLNILGEPEEGPIPLTQADFDQLILVGKSEAPEHESAENTIAFATIEPVDPEGAFMFLGAEIDENEAALYCGMGLRKALKAALEEYDSSH